MVKLLVKHGADVNAGVIPRLRVASRKGHQEVVKFLIQHGAVDNGNNLSFTLDDLGNERRPNRGIPMF
jgi:ankyrin repeat protein